MADWIASAQSSAASADANATKNPSPPPRCLISWPLNRSNSRRKVESCQRKTSDHRSSPIVASSVVDLARLAKHNAEGNPCSRFVVPRPDLLPAFGRLSELVSREVELTHRKRHSAARLGGARLLRDRWVLLGDPYELVCAASSRLGISDGQRSFRRCRQDSCSRKRVPGRV